MTDDEYDYQQTLLRPKQYFVQVDGSVRVDLPGIDALLYARVAPDIRIIQHAILDDGWAVLPRDDNVIVFPEGSRPRSVSFRFDISEVFELNELPAIVGYFKRVHVQRRVCEPPKKRKKRWWWTDMFKGQEGTTDDDPSPACNPNDDLFSFESPFLIRS